MGMNQKVVAVREALEKLGIQTEPNQDSVLDGVLGYFIDRPAPAESQREDMGKLIAEEEQRLQAQETQATAKEEAAKQDAPPKTKRTKKADAQ